jgi:hypothetical protein
MSSVTDEDGYSIVLMGAVRRALRETGFEADPARGGSRVRIIEGGALLSVTVPIIDEGHADAILDVSLDRETLGDVVFAVRRWSEAADA